jgi:hypothetical protein
VTPNDSGTVATDSSPRKSDYPYQTEWIPGQRDSGDFDVLSRFRAYAIRLPKDVLVLKLGTSAKRSSAGERTSRYIVADSVVASGLQPNELFTNDCKMGSGSIADGQIGGVPTTAVWDQWQRPRFAWRFDTVTVHIRSIAADSVSCILIQRDD